MIEKEDEKEQLPQQQVGKEEEEEQPHQQRAQSVLQLHA